MLHLNEPELPDSMKSDGWNRLERLANLRRPPATED